ncbi:MAG: hypothetical protein WCA81_10675 [Rhizomicrobium sp.]
MNIRICNPSDDAAKAGGLSQKLESVRAAIEDRFLQAGQKMASALEVLESLIATLKRLSGTLEGDTVTEAHRVLLGTTADMLDLPRAQAERREVLEALQRKSEQLEPNIECIRTTLRYLRVFALNLKIASAGAKEFIGFVEEMMERINDGGRKLALFSKEHDKLNGQLQVALSLVGELGDSCYSVLPSVVRELESCANTIRDHHREISSLAAQVAELADHIRSKVGKALMALQVGDNTRQRLEHIQAAFRFLETHNNSSGALDRQARLNNVVHHLLLAQLEDLTESFAKDSRCVVENLLGLGADARNVLELKSQFGEGQTSGFLRTLESSVSDLHGIIDRVYTVNTNAVQTGQAASQSAESLLANVGAIDSVKTDVRHMAFNTSLRCGHMGEAGRPVNVVAMELRTSADDLETSSDNIMRDLDGLTELAVRIAAHGAGADHGNILNEAVESIRTAGDGAEANLIDIARESADVAEAIKSLCAYSEFVSDLHVLLTEACEILKALADERLDDAANEDPAAREMFDKISKLWSMSREREIHRLFAPAPAEPKSKADVDPVADALF